MKKIIKLTKIVNTISIIANEISLIKYPTIINNNFVH